MASMFNNIYDVEQDINKMMSDTALSFGRLDTNGYGPMTASTFGQAEMFGRSLGTMLGGKDPRIEEAELQQELMQKHPDPRTKEDLLAVAKDAGLMGLPDVQAQMLEIASQMPDMRKANKDELGVITSQLTLTQGSDMMIDKYLKLLHGDKWDELSITQQGGLRSGVSAQFGNIIKGYTGWLGTQNLKPEDVNKILYSAEGEKRNIAMFRDYLKGLSGSNQFAKHLYDNNVQIFETIGSGTEDNKNNKNGDLNHTNLEIGDINTYTRSKLQGEESSKQFDELSKNKKKAQQNRSQVEVLRGLQQVYLDMSNFGGGIIGENNMSPSDLQQENQDDEIQKWIGGDNWRTSDAFGGLKTPNIGLRGNALNHFLELPKERFDEFLADPEAYYRKYILLKDYQDEAGNVTEQVPAKVIALWGLSD